MTTKSANLSFMNGIPELLVLQLLASREMYGYEIVRAIAESTNQVIAVGEGCVYPILHAMEKKKYVSTRRKTLDGRTRIYYTLTDKGAAQLQQTSIRWSEITTAVNTVLKRGALHAPKPSL